MRTFFLFTYDARDVIPTLALSCSNKKRWGDTFLSAVQNRSGGKSNCSGGIKFTHQKPLLFLWYILQIEKSSFLKKINSYPIYNHFKLKP